MSASAGRVLLKPKGPYNALTAYTPLDYVTYTDGNTYVCHTPTTGHAPTDTNYWQILVDNSGVVHTVDIANNLTTQTAGKVLDASQGYALNTSLAQQQNTIAYVNTSSTTASKSYAKGDQFILDGVLRVAKTAISSGATLTYNSNYINASEIATQISHVNAITPTLEQGVTINNGGIFVLGRIAFVQMNITLANNVAGAVMNGLPMPYGNTGGNSFVLLSEGFSVNPSGQMRNVKNAGTYSVSGAYLTA